MWSAILPQVIKASFESLCESEMQSKNVQQFSWITGKVFQTLFQLLRLLKGELLIFFPIKFQLHEHLVVCDVASETCMR